ncbi:hypothetical protein [Alcanivorax sp. MD8A]|uniref:hypothetical protein n=1 Tax=Alcanivorax sp. MD8A TaxID=1177157 RepID=UPI001304E62F|nr:hypothetical protein [Alcanivorax sp. MD8A]
MSTVFLLRLWQYVFANTYHGQFGHYCVTGNVHNAFARDLLAQDFFRGADS